MTALAGFLLDAFTAEPTHALPDLCALRCGRAGGFRHRLGLWFRLRLRLARRLRRNRHRDRHRNDDRRRLGLGRLGYRLRYWRRRRHRLGWDRRLYGRRWGWCLRNRTAVRIQPIAKLFHGRGLGRSLRDQQPEANRRQRKDAHARQAFGLAALSAIALPIAPTTGSTIFNTPPHPPVMPIKAVRMGATTAAVPASVGSAPIPNGVPM